MSFKELSGKPDFSEIQPRVLDYWLENHVFQKSLDIRKEKETVFYDGPPFPTGKPHHGTVLVSFIKDMIARYWTMRGYKVPRVWGWDCHGLPIENQAEQQLGITDKNEIEKNLGIDKFNEKCFEIVSSNNEAWREYINEMARWVDYDGAYKTMTPEFMESVMWAFKTCYDKGLIYRDYRVTPYCAHCETSLSISDTRESDYTRLRQDRWDIVRFRADEDLDGKPVYLMAWTTTPWTLPSNLCLAVGKDLDYAYVEIEDALYIACKSVLGNYPKIFGKNPVIVKECKGSDLLGMTYEPLFPYFAEKKSDGAFRVVSADYVGADEGVGIVHTAPAFGEDDYWTCKNNNIPLVNPVDNKGGFTEEITDFFNSPLNHWLSDEERGDKESLPPVIQMNGDIIRYLYATGKGVADGTIDHNYPHCWRCKRPLIYKAMDAYYFDIGKVKDRLIEHNESINWVPETVKHGRFGNWLAGARDWNISRNRYWSTPIPIWNCDCCGETKVLGSVEEIYQASGVKLDNLHRQFMDKVTFKCEKCDGTMTRVPEVLDCWFESGSVPFAQKHYPFENKEWFDEHFPCDFIVEYTGQIRCWFYYLHVLAVALFDKPAFKNCVVHGTILAKDGKKLSKSSKNYTDPMALMKQYGTDAFRLYLYQTDAMLIGDLKFDESAITESLTKLIFPFWNACNFFISYANIDGFHPQELKAPKTTNQLDRWMLAKLYTETNKIQSNMDSYQVDRYVDSLRELIEGLTNWYIRRSRRRFWGSGLDSDKVSAFETLYYVLVNITKLLAPVAPILAEEMYRILTGEESVHLADWPVIPAEFQDDALVNKIDTVQLIIFLGRSIRSKNNVMNRQPLTTLKVALPSKQLLDDITPFADVIGEELNVKNVELLSDVGDIAVVKYDPDFNAIRNLYPKRVGDLVKTIKSGKFRLEGDSAVLNIDGVEESFPAEVIQVKYLAKDGLFVASDKGIVATLDLTITEELRQEGMARQIVRQIQDARKQQQYAIADHISIQILEGDVPENWIGYICGETLSTVAVIDEPDTVIEIADGNIRIAIKK